MRSGMPSPAAIAGAPSYRPISPSVELSSMMKTVFSRYGRKSSGIESTAACAASSNCFMLTRMHELKRVLVVGAGTMGSQIALQTALSGRYDVTLVDSLPGQLERAGAQNRRLMDRAVEKGRLTEDGAAAALARITPSSDLASSARSADLVIEAVIEDFDA